MGWLPQMAGLPSLNGGGTAASVPPPTSWMSSAVDWYVCILHRGSRVSGCQRYRAGVRHWRLSGVRLWNIYISEDQPTTTTYQRHAATWWRSSSPIWHKRSGSPPTSCCTVAVRRPVVVARPRRTVVSVSSMPHECRPRVTLLTTCAEAELYTCILSYCDAFHDSEMVKCNTARRHSVINTGV